MGYEFELPKRVLLYFAAVEHYLKMAGGFDSKSDEHDHCMTMVRIYSERAETILENLKEEEI